MWALTSKDGDLSSPFDKIDKSEVEIENSSLHHHLLNNRDVAVNEGRIWKKLPLEQLFGFCKIFEKVAKQLGFYLTFETADLQDYIYTRLGDNVQVNFSKLFLYVPIFIPDASTQTMFNDSIKNSFTSSLGSWSTDKKPVTLC